MNDAHIVCLACGAVNRLPASRLDADPRCGRCHAPLFRGEPAGVGQAQFDTLLRRDSLPLLVDFWASWCGPCRMMAPAFAAAARSLEPRVRLVKVDTEAEQALAARYAIRSIPSLLLFRGGRELARQAGAMTEAQITGWVRQQLG